LVNKKFQYEYDNQEWDSLSSGLASFSLKNKAILNQVGGTAITPGTVELNDDLVNLCFTPSACTVIGDWQTIPYVRYDSVVLTDKPLFYTVSFSNDPNDNFGAGLPQIFVNVTKTGIDLNQQLSLGIGRLHP
jgi:hypothetical protein